MECDLSSIELLSHPNVHNWPHFDVVESEKLEWMKDIANSLPKLKPGQSYEARFDWKGVLLPYFTPETDGDRELFLHETDAQRPGYTLQELFRLARSASGFDFNFKFKFGKEPNRFTFQIECDAATKLSHQCNCRNIEHLQSRLLRQGAGSSNFENIFPAQIRIRRQYSDSVGNIIKSAGHSFLQRF